MIRLLSDGKPQVMKDMAFCTILHNHLPAEDVLFSTLFGTMDAAVRSELRIIAPTSRQRITTEALSNVHGDWYEWLLAIASWNLTASLPNTHLAISLPNVSQFDVSSLYINRLHDLIADLKVKVSAVSEVSLITSNPDFVILDRTLVNEILGSIEPIDTISPTTLSELGNKYRAFIGRCDYSHIVGYVSVKMSLRPDRRLQIPHEGSLMKAIYTHLQTREWIINPKGLKYYAISSQVGTPDRKALKTVATHSITTVSSLPQAAVDEVFEANSIRNAIDVFSRILTF